MTHNYPLHQDIQAQCLCCLSAQPFTFTSPNDQVVCPQCVRHIGSEKSERRDREHVTAWAARFAEEQQSNTDFAAASVAVIGGKDVEIAGLAEQVAQLGKVVTGNFDHTAVGGVRELLENDLIKRAERRAQLAAKQVDWAMAVIWRLNALHRVDPGHPQLCTCGKSSVRCAELSALEPLRQALADWESKNLRLARSGQRHGLPAEHPELRT
ncbi:hypothetical protein E3T55_14345 [Cryobacterium frigoriphilum]|uniref:Uncharacterized protein n=1 Tax=Cryobacterium frigoriphilum TaxID=1259150 RepID=A0A4R8ZWA3_9MICO|nr:hypothetical protein [Cryobacterium frigoriphilum]TFD47741.1 hypothetical protein E3T55_14345 [Cryobacterium frigoriphilum]